MKNFAKKLTSRKFLVSAAGIASGIVLISLGNAEEGMATIIASIIAYLAAEGLVDVAAVKNKTDEMGDAIEEAEVKSGDT